MKTTASIKLFVYFLSTCLLPVNSLFAGGVRPTDPNLKAKANQWMGQSKQLGFQENKGQMADTDGKPTPYVLFKAEAPGINIWVTTTGLTYQFLKFEEKQDARDKNQELRAEALANHSKDENMKVSWHRVDMILKNASIKKENIVTEGDITQGKIDFYLGNCPDGIFNVKTLSKITIKNIYEGIDWVLYTNNYLAGNSLKQDFIVHPNANVNQIKLIYEGSGKFDVTNNQIHFENEIGELQEGKLFCYQGNENNEITSKYTVTKNKTIQNLGAGNFTETQEPRTKNQEKINNNQLETLNPKSEIFSYEIGIQLSNYDKSKELIIDPKLVWGTFFGGANDYVTDVKCDLFENVFITGHTYGINFPLLNSGGVSYFQNNVLTFGSGFISKFDKTGVILWSTFYSGIGWGPYSKICVDLNGNVFIGSKTDGSAPTMNPGGGAYFQGVFSGILDILILKFSNTGQRLWATYYGGSGGDHFSDICCDLNGNITIVGWSFSPNLFLLNAGGSSYFQSIPVGIGAAPKYTIILKFNINLQCILATCYGGGYIDQASSVTTDLYGNTFVVGESYSNNIPLVNPGAGTFFSGALGGSRDLFILKFNNNNSLVWATYFGGSFIEELPNVCCDINGNLFITGRSTSNNIPISNWVGTSYLQANLNGNATLFISKFNNNGSLLWSTYFGGGMAVQDHDICVDECNNLYVGYSTISKDSVVQSSCLLDYNDSALNLAYDSWNNVLADFFIAKFNKWGTLVWSSYVGGDGGDISPSIAIDKNNNLYLTGNISDYNYLPTTSITYPFVNFGGGAYFDNTFNYASNQNFFTTNLFISKFSPLSLSGINITTDDMKCNCSNSASIQICTSYQYNWYNNNWGLIGNSDTIYNLCQGAYQVVSADTINCPTISDTVFFTVNGNNGPTANTSQNIAIQQGANTTLTATGGSIYNWSPSTGLNTTTGNTVIASPTQTTVYCAEVTDANGCKDTACVTVSVEFPCSTKDNLKIPNAFSPNDDNVNDEFCLQGWNYCVEEFSVTIFDRWGEKIFESTNPDFCWDGMYNGKTMDAQVFVYYIEAKYQNVEEKIVKKGNISLIR